MPILYFDADYVYENIVVLLPIFSSPWEIMRRGKIPCCIDLAIIPGDNNECIDSSLS